MASYCDSILRVLLRSQTTGSLFTSEVVLPSVRMTITHRMRQETVVHGHCDCHWETLSSAQTPVPVNWEEEVIIDVSQMVPSLIPVETLGVLPDPDGLFDGSNCPVTFLLHQLCTVPAWFYVPHGALWPISIFLAQMSEVKDFLLFVILVTLSA